MTDSLYYVVYDISSNIIRTKVIIALKNAGLSRIQESVFCGALNGQQFKDLKTILSHLVVKEDKLYIIQSCEKCFGKLDVIGKSFDIDYVANRKGGEVI